MTTLYTPFIDVTVNALWSDWQNYPNGRPNPLYSQQATSWGVDGLVLGFLTLSPSNQACWAASDAMPLAWALPLANDLNAANRQVIVSFGGASNADISTKFTVDQLVQTYTNVVQSFKAKALDFDLENGQYNTVNICAALAIFQKANPTIRISFTLPTLPAGLVAEGLSIVQTAKNAGLNFSVNGMAMDYNDGVSSQDMGKAATNAAKSIKTQLATFYPTLTDAQLYAKVAITPMIGLNDDTTEMFKLPDATTVAEFAKQNSMAFIGSWSFNRDNPSSYTYVDLQTSSNPAQKASGDYAKAFVAGSR